MRLEFPELVSLVQEIKISQQGKPLIDSEVAFLQCAWDGIAYSKFVLYQDMLTEQYSQCYKDRLRSKSDKTIASCGSRLIAMLREHFKNQDIERVNLRRVFESLVEKGDVKVASRAITSIEETSNDTELLSLTSEEFIILNQDTEEIIKFLNSSVPLALMYGIPGIGKTRLLNYIRHNYIDNNNYKIIYIDLRYISSLEQLAFEILSQFGLNIGDVDKSELSTLAFNYINSKNIILILDSIFVLPTKVLAFIETFALRDRLNQSKIILSSQKKIDFSLPEVMIKYYRMKGLIQPDDIISYFRYLGLKNEKYWRDMANFYEGSFREISYAAQFICDFFSADVGDYWVSGSRVISPTLFNSFQELKFTQIDLNIFSMFSSGTNIISSHIVQALRSDSGSSKIFSRINYLCDLGLLIKKTNLENKLTSYSIAPLLKAYLIQEGLIDA